MTVIVAIASSRLATAGVTAATPSVRAAAPWRVRSSRALSRAPRGVSTASSSGPLEPAPNASPSRS
jgi:hypothetical protein